jgi:hypothetical protein
MQWIPNFNKLDITIDVGTILGKYTLPNMPAFAPKVFEVPVRQAKVIPHRDSCQINKTEVHFLY